jgi:RNA polymerase sigma-70 factor (ECF subfamily)
LANARAEPGFPLDEPHAVFRQQAEQIMHTSVRANMDERLDGHPGAGSQQRAGSGVRDADMHWREDLLAQTPALRAFAWSLSHDAAEADDLVQDTLVRAWSHRDRFTQGTNLRAWLFTILRNTFYTALSRRRREVRDEDGQEAARLVSPADQEWSVSLNDLRTALNRLPPTHREALVLVGGAGMTYQEAADVCGCAIGTIKSRVNRARARLMVLLDPEGNNAESAAPSEHED